MPALFRGDRGATRPVNLMEMMDAADNDRLKVMWCIGYDILLTNPNMSATCRALQKMDAVIVQDMFFERDSPPSWHNFPSRMFFV